MHFTDVSSLGIFITAVILYSVEDKDRQEKKCIAQAKNGHPVFAAQRG